MSICKNLKILFLGTSILILTNCSGARTTVVDEPTGVKRNTVNLGQIEVLHHPGVIGSMRGELSEIIKKDGSQFYVLGFTSSAEGFGKESCPLVRKNAQVTFTVDGQEQTFRTTQDSNILYPLPGFLLLTCIEHGIEIGSLSKDFLRHLASAKEVKFQIKGENGEILGKINPFEQNEISRFLINSESSY